jgi:hypothetical protein
MLASVVVMTPVRISARGPGYSDFTVPINAFVDRNFKYNRTFKSVPICHSSLSFDLIPC